MKSILLKISALLLFFSLLSCSDGNDLSNYIPQNTKSITCINTPQIKSKVLTWDVIKKYFFSGSKDENLDYSLDLDRKAYVYFDKDSAEFPVILFPISDVKVFEAAIIKKYAEAKITESNAFKYIDTPEDFTIAWQEGFAVIARKSTVLENISKQKDINPNVPKNISQDIAGKYAPLDLDFDLSFNNGEVVFNIKGKEKLNTLIKNQNLPVPANANPLPFKSEKGFFSLNTSTTDIEQVNKLMSILSQGKNESDGLITPQFAALKPYLDGRVYVNLTKDNKSYALGVNPTFKAVKAEFLKDYTFDASSKCYTHNTIKQSIFEGDDFLYFSPEKTMTKGDVSKTSLLDFNITSEIVDEDIFLFPKMLFGADKIDAFPFSGISISVDKEKNELSATANLKCKNKEQNSLLSILEATEKLKKKEEI